MLRIVSRRFPDAFVERRLLGGYLRKWMILGVLIGIVAGLGAIVFYTAIQWATALFLGKIVGLTPPLPRGEGVPLVSVIGHRWLLPVVTTLGGLLSGLIVFTLAPEAEGHGTDAAIAAFHEHGGKIRSRIPPIKLVASAITIGSGGSAGREGPTAQIAAGFGSWLGDALRLSVQDRRIAVAVGMGAGIGAIFKAPLGGAILAAEILYRRDFEPDAIVPGFIASVVGYSIFGAWSGWTPVFGFGPGLAFNQPESLIWYTLLGVLAGVVGVVYVRVFYRVRDLFHALRLPPHVKPALGGLGVGLIGLAFPQVISMGYGWVQLAIDGNTAQLAVGTMLALVVFKIVATALTISSGGSGGVFAPGLYIGGMLGGGLWGLLHTRVPGLPAVPAPFVIVGMLALFGGIAKAPIAVMLMVAEMTGEFSLLVPAMFAATIAYLVSGDVSIYENQVPTRAQSPAHRGEYTIPLLQVLTVGQAMRRAVVTTAPSELVMTAEQRMAEHGLRGLPVVEDGRLVGMFTATDALHARQAGKTVVSEVMHTELVLAYPADTLHTALQRMTRAGVSRLPVVERERPEHLLGILTTRDLAAALDLEVNALASQSPDSRRAPTDDPLQSITVRAAMSRRFETVAESMPLTRVANRLASAGRYAALVINGQGALVGIATLRDLRQAVAAAGDNDRDRPIGTIATRRVIVARATQTVAEALAQPGAEGLRQLPVVEEQAGKRVPVGLLQRSDVLAAYLRGRDRQALIARRANTLASAHPTDVITVEVLVGPTDAAAGRSLAELQLPRDAIVTAVLRDGTVLIPHGQLTVEPGDRVQLTTTAVMRETALACFASRPATELVAEPAASAEHPERDHRNEKAGAKEKHGR
ncbi:MAG: chloride channel protein [Dehalococcoidia bacterium]